MTSLKGPQYGTPGLKEPKRGGGRFTRRETRVAEPFLDSSTPQTAEGKGVVGVGRVGRVVTPFEWESHFSSRERCLFCL